MSTKQTVGHFTLNPGPLGSTQNIHVLPEPLLSAQMPLEITLSSQGSLGSSSSQKAFRHSYSAQETLKVFTSKQGNVQTLSSAQKTLQPPTSYQAVMRVSPSSPHAAQTSSSSPRHIGHFLASQKSQEFFCTSPSDLGHCSPILDAEKYLVPAPGVLGALLSSQKQKELFRAAEQTMPVQNSFISNQGNRGTSAYSATGQGFAEPLPSIHGNLGYSSSALRAQDTSTATPGHVVSDDSPMECSISAQLIPLFSSLNLLDPSLSIEGTIDLSKPTEDTRGLCATE